MHRSYYINYEKEYYINRYVNVNKCHLHAKYEFQISTLES